MMNKKTVLTHAERVRLALEHKETDRIPIALAGSGINHPANLELNEWLRRERGIDLQTFLEPLIDIKGIEPAYIGPTLPPETDIWGVRHKPTQSGKATYWETEYYPLAGAESVDEIAAHPWPSADWYDYAGLRDEIASLKVKGNYYIMTHTYSIFEYSWYMRGMDNFLMDLALRPELAHAIMERVTDFHVRRFTRILQAAGGDIDMVFGGDDLGTQQTLMISVEMWFKHIRQYQMKFIKAMHEFGVKIMFHSDGAIMEAVHGLIDMGVDVLQALQFDATGMDPVLLKKKYGGRLCFEGGVSVQKTLPFGTPDAVRREVIERIDVLGRNGGYIIGPAHAIQAGTPPENIVALFDTAKAYYPWA